MPNCVVPMCDHSTKLKSHSNCSYYRFPTDTNIRQKWISRIRIDNYAYKYNDRICSCHFPNGKGESPWNIEKNMDINFPAIVQTRAKRGTKGYSRPVLAQTASPTTITGSKRKQTISPTMYNSPKKAAHTPVTSNITRSMLNEELENLKQAFSKVNQELAAEKVKSSTLEEKILDLSNNNLKCASQVQLLTDEVARLKTAVSEAKDQINYLEIHNASKTAEIDTSATTIKSLGIINSELEKKLKNVEEDRHCSTICTKFSLDKIQEWDSNLLSSFTGFSDFSSIRLIHDVLVKKNILYTTKKTVKKIGFQHQLIITLFKLKLDLSNSVLGYLFGVSHTTISTIFNSFLYAIYQMFYEGDGVLTTIPSRYKNAKCLPKSFATMSNCRIVIDCTEFIMETPATLEQKKSIYSHYKSRYTGKVLIGCAPNGTVTFVSNLFGGSESDKSIVLQSKLLEQMQPGDLILADKGFQLFDILPPGVELNIPSFLINGQFTVNEIKTNHMYASARIIVERLNAKFKVFKILNILKGTNRDKSEMIVKVCVALTLLMPTLMEELNVN